EKWAGQKPYEYGTKFSTTVPGVISKVRMITAPGETGQHTIRIWNADTTVKLFEASWTPIASSDWQEVVLPAPLHIDASVNYIVAVSTGTDSTAYVAYISGYFNNGGG